MSMALHNIIIVGTRKVHDQVARLYCRWPTLLHMKYRFGLFSLKAGGVLGLRNLTCSKGSHLCSQLSDLLL